MGEGMAGWRGDGCFLVFHQPCRSTEVGGCKMAGWRGVPAHILWGVLGDAFTGLLADIPRDGEGEVYAQVWQERCGRAGGVGGWQS